MRYRSLIEFTAAALLIAVPVQASAQTAFERAARLAQKEDGQLARYRLERASFEVQPEPEVQSRHDEAELRDPEQATRSAAYAWEAGFLALSAIDAAETISCLNRNRCTEGNFIWGRHPSTGKILGAKIGLGLIHFGVVTLVARRDPHTALRVAQVSAAVQGGFVLINLRHVF